MTGGLPLRFCASLGQAHREHGGAAASTLLARHGGVLPAIIADDETRLFSAQLPMPARAAALTLLHTLLAADRRDRPASGIEISRLLARIASSALATSSLRSAA